MKSVDVALSGVRRLYVDSAPIIYYVEANPSYIAMMQRIVRIIQMTDLKAYSSALTMAEVLVMPLRQGDQRLVRAYKEILSFSGAYTLSPVTADIGAEAADLRARYRLRTPDALHVATAIATHCEAMLTNDSDMKRIDELSILLLDDLE